MPVFRIYKRLMDLFKKGELIRLKSSGEIFVYETSTGGANFTSYLVVNVGGKLIDYPKILHVDDVEKVNRNGGVIDDFQQYANNR